MLIALLWPEPARVSRVGRLSRRSNTCTGYVVIPSVAKPKLLVPSRPRRVAAAAVRNFKTASSAREQFVIGSLALAFRLGLADLLPHRLRIEYPAGVTPVDIEAHLSGVLGRPVQVSLYIGPPRAVRKPVLQVLDERGATFAFAKLGIDAFTQGLVRAEAEAVSFLAAIPWSVLCVPEVLHSGVWRGHELLVQSAFPRGAAAEPGNEKLSAAMDELARARGIQTAALVDSPYWHRLTERVRNLPRTQFAALLDRAIAAIETSSGTSVLEFGSWHGDWTPWNMTVSDGRVRVWDWEKFEHGVPIGFDAVHFDVQGAVVLAATPPALAFQNTMERSSDLLRPHGVAADAAALVVWLYAVDIAVRYLEDREMAAGQTRMSHLSNWLESVLDTAAAGVSGAYRP